MQAVAAEINKAMTENDVESATPSSVTDSSANSVRFNVQGLNRSWQLFQTGCALATKTKIGPSDELEKTMILDSGSSINLFCNENWLDNIKHSKTPEHLAANAGNVSVLHEGTPPNFGAVPYHPPDAVTNITSLASLSDRHRVTFDSDKDNAFLVHTPEKIVRFERHESNLCSHKPDSLNNCRREPIVLHPPRKFKS